MNTAVGVMRLMTVVQLVLAVIVTVVFWNAMESAGIVWYVRVLEALGVLLVLCLAYAGASTVLGALIIDSPWRGALVLLALDVVYIVLLVVAFRSVGTGMSVAIVSAFATATLFMLVTWVCYGFSGKAHEWDTFKGFIKTISGSEYTGWK